LVSVSGTANAETIFIYATSLYITIFQGRDFFSLSSLTISMTIRLYISLENMVTSFIQLYKPPVIENAQKFIVELNELGDTLRSSILCGSLIQLGKTIYLGGALLFSRCPGSWGKLKRSKTKHLSIKNNGD
jgi:hypothetical protein